MRTGCGIWPIVSLNFCCAFPSVVRIVEVADSATTRTKVCKPCSETDYEPFFQFERLKQDSLHQLEGFAKRLEDFDSRLASIHARHCEAFCPSRSSAMCQGTTAWAAVEI